MMFKFLLGVFVALLIAVPTSAQQNQESSKAVFRVIRLRLDDGEVRRTAVPTHGPVDRANVTRLQIASRWFHVPASSMGIRPVEIR